MLLINYATGTHCIVIPQNGCVSKTVVFQQNKFTEPPLVLNMVKRNPTFSYYTKQMNS